MSLFINIVAMITLLTVNCDHWFVAANSWNSDNFLFPSKTYLPTVINFDTLDYLALIYNNSNSKNKSIY